MKTTAELCVLLCLAFFPLPAGAQVDWASLPAAVEAGAFSVNTKNDSLGSVQTGSTKTDSVTVTNTGTTTLTISSVKSSNARFTAGPASASLPAGTSRKFGVTFAPAVTGVQTSFIVFTHDGPTGQDTVAASGTGTAPAFSAGRKSIAYGYVVIATGKPDSVVVTNTGTAPLVITNVTSSSGRFVASPTSGTIQPGAKSTFKVTFTPTASGTLNANIVFRNNSPTIRDTVAVSGTGTGFSPSRRSLSFGKVVIGTAARDSIVVTNAGAVTLTVTNVTSTNGAFAVRPVSASIAAAGSAKFYITFSPAGVSPQSGGIVFTHSAASSPDTIGLSGTGGTVGFSVSRWSIAFGTVAVGSNKRDSLTVSDTGSVTLVISSVTSGNPAFTVSPASASVEAGDSRMFYFTFTPASGAVQTGNVVFIHNAPGGHDTIGVSGTGGVSGFIVSRRKMSFGNVVVGSSRSDTVAVTDTGKAPLVINNITSSNGRFTVNPPNATIAPGGSASFTLAFSPLNTNPQTGNIVFTHNAPEIHDTVSVSGTGAAPLPPPVLLSPATGSSGLTLPATLSWNGVSGATGYWLQMATDPAFATLAISDSTIDTTFRQASGIPLNTTYFWRVSTHNDAGFGQFSAAWTITTPPSGTVSGTVSFSGDVSSASYRMFGLPGIGTRKAGDIFTGTQKIDWRLLRDTGKDTTYPAYYVDLASDSLLNPGEAYWLLLRKDLTVTRTDTLPPIAPDGTYSIPLHGGWNMIANPFNASVARAAVIAANGLPASTVFWEHAGSVRTDTGTTLDPFKGYYFDNDTSSLGALKIPYPFRPAVAKLAKAKASGWRAELVFEGGINSDRGNYIGIAAEAKPGRNEFDHHEAPLVFDEGFLYFVRPQWDAAHPRFATDIRTALGTGQTWDFEVWNPGNGAGKITINGLEDIPASCQVVLVDLKNTAPVDLRRSGGYAYRSAPGKSEFKLLVGTKEYVDGETSLLVPQAFDLAQNYPNPFNPSTTISYMLPAGSFVRLEILSVLGQRVRLLDEGFRPAASYSVVWDGRSDAMRAVSSGVYFCRLVAGDRTIRIRKLLLVK